MNECTETTTMPREPTQQRADCFVFVAKMKLRRRFCDRCCTFPPPSDFQGDQRWKYRFATAICVVPGSVHTRQGGHTPDAVGCLTAAPVLIQSFLLVLHVPASATHQTFRLNTSLPQGYLTPEQLTAIMYDAELGLTGPELQLVIAEADENADGTIDVRLKRKLHRFPV